MGLNDRVGSSLDASSLPPEQRGFDRGPVEKNAASELDVGHPAIAFPSEECPTADRQSREQFQFSYERLAVWCGLVLIAFDATGATHKANSPGADFWQSI